MRRFLPATGFSGFLYRLRQFYWAVSAAPGEEELALAAQTLSPAQMALFRRMQPSEQAHSLAIFRRLHAIHTPTAPHDLLAAALLHDSGKTIYPLHLWERVWIVLAKAFIPQQVERWGSRLSGSQITGWRRPFIVSVQHPAWGAELAAQAGASPLTVSLIRRHQDKLSPAGNLSLEDQLLLQLQRFDEER